MRVRISNNYWVIIAFFFLTIQNSKFFIANEFSDLIEYAGLGILLVGCTKLIWGNKDKECRKRKILFLVCSVLMNFGLLFQDLPINKIVYLCTSITILAYISIFPNGFLKSEKDFRAIANAILLGIGVSTLLALVTGMGVVTGASEGFIFSYGFDGGLEHRNFYAYALLGVLILYNLSEKLSNSNRRYPIIIIFILLIISNSRSSYIVVLLYSFFTNYRKIRIQRMSKKEILYLFIILLIIFGIPTYRFLTQHSETFFFRVNGLRNYFKYIGNDWNQILLGNADIAFANTGMSYDENIRSVIGWDGSVELVFLNIMIKSGLIGFIGYVLIFVDYFKKIKNTKVKAIQPILYGVLVSFIVSAFVESYVTNINLVYSPLCYTLLATLPQIELQNKTLGEIENIYTH